MATFLRMRIVKGETERHMQESCISSEAEGSEECTLPFIERHLHGYTNLDREVAAPVSDKC